MLPCAGTIEYALAEDRLTEEGDVWVPEEDDITLTVRCAIDSSSCWDVC